MPEDQNIEWKASWRDEYLKWICGFANAQGGRVYIGMDDNGLVTGISNYQQLMEDIPNKIVSMLGIMPEVNLLEQNGLFYIEINVAPSSVPVNYKGEYHYRCGSTRQQLKGAALNDFLTRKTGVRWDAAPITQLGIEDLDRGSFNIFRRAARGSGRLSDADLNAPPAELLERLHLLDNGKLTRAAALLFYHDPERFQLGCYVKIGRFTAGTQLLYQDELHGSLIELADKVVELLFLKYFKAVVSYNKELRVERYPYPRAAVREVVYNALVHCNWADCVPVQIRVDDDMLMISNSCILPWGWGPSELTGIHSSRPFNPLIANTFFRAGYIEAWGRGINTVFDYCRANNYPEPVYKINGSDINVIFPSTTRSAEQGSAFSSGKAPENGVMPNRSKLSQNEILIVMEIQSNASITQVEIAKNTGISRRNVQTCIKNMEQLGILHRSGARKTGKWIIQGL